MAIAMVAMLAFGGTYAYFTATATAQTASITTGHVKLSANDTFTVTATDVLPGDTVAAGGVTLTVDTSSEEGDWVAIKVTISGEKATQFAIDTTSVGSDWTETSTGSGIFVSTAKVTDTIQAFAEGFTISTDVTDNWTQGEDASDNALMNATVTVTVNAVSIQGDNVTRDVAVTQLTAMFA